MLPHTMIRFPKGEPVRIDGASLMRVAIVSDEGRPETDEQITAALKETWHLFAASIERRNLVATGTWALGIVDHPENWREHIFGATRTNMEEALRNHPECEVVMVVGLFDTANADVKPYIVEDQS
jgi:hypothetical protein